MLTAPIFPLTFQMALTKSDLVVSAPSAPVMLLDRLPPAACVLVPKRPSDCTASDFSPIVLPASMRPRSPLIATVPRSMPVALM